MADELDKYIEANGGVKDAEGNITQYSPTTVARVAAVAPQLSDPIAEPGASALGQPGSKAFQQATSYSLGDRKFQFDEEHKRHQETIAELQMANQHATQVMNAVKTKTELQNQLETKLDTADFMQKFASISHTDPDYEEKVGWIAATHPLAGADPSVKEMLSVKHEVRSIYTDVMKQGGVSQFDGPARDMFMQVAKDTGGDIVQAHAAAKRVTAAELQLDKDKRNGFITAEDLNSNSAYDQNGHVNYNYLRNKASMVEGDRAGKAARADNADEKRDLAFMERMADNRGVRDTAPDSPLKRAYQAVASRQNARDVERASGAPPSAPPASAGASAVKRYTTGF